MNAYQQMNIERGVKKLIEDEYIRGEFMIKVEDNGCPIVNVTWDNEDYELEDALDNLEDALSELKTVEMEKADLELEYDLLEEKYDDLLERVVKLEQKVEEQE